MIEKDIDFTKYTLHILQTKSHVNFYLRKFHNFDNHLLFPISVDAIQHLEKNNLDFITFDDLLKNKESDLKKIYTDKIDNLFKKLNYELENYSNELNFTIESFRFQLDIVLGNLFFLNHLKYEILSFNFRKIICYETFTLSGFIYKYRPNPRRVLFQIFNDRKTNKNLNRVLLFPEKYILKEEVKNFLKTYIWLFIRNFIKKSKKDSKSKSYLLLGGEYDWPLYLQDRQIIFSRLNRRIIFWNNRRKSQTIKRIIERTFRRDLPFSENIYKGFLKNLINNIAYEINYIISNKSFFDELLKSRKAILTSCIVDPLEAYICLLFKANNKEVILWQHGENGILGERDILTESSELRICTKYIGYTQNVINYLEKNMNCFLPHLKKPKFFEVGSVSKKVNYNTNNKIQKTRILLCAGKFFGISRFFNNLGDPDIRLYKIHKSFLKVAEEFSEKYEFVLKANNTLMFNHLPYELSDSYSLNYKDRFTDLLVDSKAVILDTPATTLIEALSTTVPIFAIKGRSLYTKEFVEMSSKRVCWCDDNLDLENKLKEFLVKGTYNADVNNKEFMKAYLGENNVDFIWRKVDKILKISSD